MASALPLGFLWILFLISTSSSATSDETCGPECELLKYCQSKDIDGQALKLCEIYMKNTESSLLDSRYQLDINNKNETKNQFDCNKKPPSSGKVWGYGMLCVTIISLMSVMGVSFLPLMSKSFYDKLLTTLIGLAIGSLFGSAVFHLIPAAFSLAEFEYFKHHEYLYNSLVIWFGVYLFFIIERILKICMEFKNHKHGFQRPTGNKKESYALEKYDYIFFFEYSFLESKHVVILQLIIYIFIQMLSYTQMYFTCTLLVTFASKII